MTFDKKMIDEILKGYEKPEDLFGKNGVFTKLKKAVLERALEGELTHHLGYDKNEQAAEGANYRNGKTAKKVITDTEELELEIPRDREGSFEPKLIPKHVRRLTGFDDKILSMYARGMSQREIAGHLKEIYAIDVSPDLISTVTDGVIEEVETWQSRPLDRIYPIVYMDAIVLKIKDNNQVKNKALYLAVGINMDGNKEILGMWLSINEGAKFWLSVVTELKNRGVQDILIACVDGLKGFPEAINAVYPLAQVQLCIVHMIRHSLSFVPWKDRKAIAQDLKEIYTACNEPAARVALEIFRSKWDRQYPTIGASWERNWAGIVPFLAYPDFIRRAIYTTNIIESINYSIRRVTKNRIIFPDDKAAYKLVYMALKNLAKRWTMPIHHWKQALNQFAIVFGDRIMVN
jgi:putative transposase